MSFARIKILSRTIAVLSLSLIALGGFVRATGAGLACPDWPLCYGQIVPPLTYGVTQEFAHRVLASIVGLLTAVLSYVSFASRQSYPYVWRFCQVLLGLLIVQIIFGGLTVTMRLNPIIVTTHLALGTLFFQIVSLLGYEPTSLERLSKEESEVMWIRKVLLLLTVLVFFQIILGGFVGSNGASLACPEFPNCGVTSGGGTTASDHLHRAQQVHMAHRALGFLILVVAVIARYAARKRSTVTKHRLSFILDMVVLQIVVGAFNVYFRIPVSVTVMHLVIAQGILLMSTAALWLDSRWPTVTIKGDQEKYNREQAQVALGS